MIIGGGRSVGLREFTYGLGVAGRAVVRVQDPLQSIICSGWLITEWLVVVPAFAARQRSADRPEQVERQLQVVGDGSWPPLTVSVVYMPDDDFAPALLRLGIPAGLPHLRLELASTTPDERVLLLHYPMGVADIQMSFGRVLGVDGARIQHDAATEIGSAGAPVLNVETLAVMGMHVAASNPDAGRFNEALSLVSMIESLRESAEWPEIATVHGLTDVATARRNLDAVDPKPRERADPDLLKAAVRWSFDPATISPEAATRLRRSVTDPFAPRWTLRGRARRRAIVAAGSPKVLLEARGAFRDDDGPGQRAIDRILDGPLDLAMVADDELPYLLQAVRWFAGVVPGLPSAGEVSRDMEHRRVRGRLEALVGRQFRGRRDELGRLTSWFATEAAGPLVVSGIGGVGKSALIARFALDHDPEQTVLLWLDFDRADLAPDDAASVLAVLGGQLAVQVEGITVPEPADPDVWQETADALGEQLSACGRVLLVLDGFEIAQHAKRHAEIWDVLGRLLELAPRIGVVVSGRAPVPGLTLAGRPAVRPIVLAGLPTEEARRWLIDRGVRDPKVLEAVLRIADGVPLVLKLAARLVEAGGDVADLPATLPHTLVDGFLYQRILDRVVDQELKPVARDALVLRRLTVDVLTAVLHDSLPLDAGAEDVFGRLAQEMALVDDLDRMGAPDPNRLRLRPEVRAATLRLLELDDPDRVREIDRRAESWYRRHDLDDDINAAELVYHRLRLGDVDGAQRGWRPELASLLTDAEDDLPESALAARAWLRERTAGAAESVAGLAVWEQDALGRIRSVIKRGLIRGIATILDERPDRSAGSPLVAYDAWNRWQAGDLAGARRMLAEAARATGRVERARVVLGARLAAEAGDRDAADELLARVDDPSMWADVDAGGLAVTAARVRLTVDIAAEVELADMVDDDELQGVRGLLKARDVVLPSLYRKVASVMTVESYGLTVPTTPDQLPAFAADVEWAAGDYITAAGPMHGPVLAAAQRLRDLAARRWAIATSTTFVYEACRRAADDDAAGQLAVAACATLAVFRGQQLAYVSGSGTALDLDDVVRQLVPNVVVAEPVPDVVRREIERDTFAGALKPGKEWMLPDETWRTGLNGFALYVTGPDPLDVLCHTELGVGALP